MRIVTILFFTLYFIGCKKVVIQHDDEIYSQYLHESFQLTILSTPLPNNKNKANLLILNDGQDIEKLRAKPILDSLFRKKLIEPLIIVAIHTGDRLQEYGVANLPAYNHLGTKAGEYDAFISDELFNYIKNRSGILQFKSVAIAGCSLGGLSAFDIAWNHPDKINKVGVFSGSFWWRDKDLSDPGYSDDKDRILLNKIRMSDEKPHLKYWFYAGAKEESSDRNKNGIIDVIDDTKDLISIIKRKEIGTDKDIVYTESPDGKHDYPYWSRVFPDFLLWAFGK